MRKKVRKMGERGKKGRERRRGRGREIDRESIKNRKDRERKTAVATIVKS